MPMPFTRVYIQTTYVYSITYLSVIHLLSCHYTCSCVSIQLIFQQGPMGCCSLSVMDEMPRVSICEMHWDSSGATRNAALDSLHYLQ